MLKKSPATGKWPGLLSFYRAYQAGHAPTHYSRQSAGKRRREARPRGRIGKNPLVMAVRLTKVLLPVALG